MIMEYKFRVWHKKEKRFIDLNGFSIAFNSCLNVGSVYAVTEQGVLKEYNCNEVEIVMFTGLKDKNGKEIYDGDIVKQDTQIDEVSFNEGHWIIKPEGDGLFHYAQYIEIIGNIHENPELL